MVSNVSERCNKMTRYLKSKAQKSIKNYEVWPLSNGQRPQNGGRGGPPLRLDQLDHQNLFARGLFGLFSRSGSWLTRRWSQANQCWVRKQSLRYIRQPPIHQKDGKRVILHHKVFCLTTRERRDEYAVKERKRTKNI